MPNVQIGNFRRPGIFTQEFDRSIIEAPTVTGIQNLVLGFAKKGPYNTPVVLNNTTDLEETFGQIDRRLERKGSFFHRTIAKLLESDPVVAINLLITDDNLDTLEYKSFSTSTGFFNDVKRTGPYRRFFDRAGFWQKDTESFINLASENPNADERILHFTNMGEKPFTVFTFKSSRRGFDVDMVEWFGSLNEVPLFAYPTDLVSDYMVDVLVLSGDWTNYQQLAVDSRWGRYFSNAGLRKDQVLNFVNDPANNVLSYYQGLSLIPFFRDQNGNDLFIENVINRDTDRTGLFCAYDLDKVQDLDFPTGLIDLIGNNIIGSDQDEVRFLSYKDVISEDINYTNVYLDRPGNVLSFGNEYKGTPLTISERTANFAEGYVFNYKFEEIVSSSTTYEFEYNNINPSDEAYAVMGGEKIDITNDFSFTLDANDYQFPQSGMTSSTYVSVAVLTTDGEVNLLSNQITTDRPQVSATDIVLGYLDITVVDNGGIKEFSSVIPEGVTLDDTGFIELEHGVDYLVDTDGNGNITWEFLDTNTNDLTLYEEYRRIKTFNALISNLTGPNRNRMVLLDDSRTKHSIESMNVSNIQTSTAVNKEFTLETGLDENILSIIIGSQSPLTNDNAVCFYLVDDEFIIGKDGMFTNMEQYDTTDDRGIVARYSRFYENYRDGIINTKDYFYQNVLPTSNTIKFIKDNGSNYIWFETNPTIGTFTISINSRFIVPDSQLNQGIFTIINTTPNTSLGSPISGFAYEVNENVVEENVGVVSRLWDANERLYLKMYLELSGDMFVRFMDEQLESQKDIGDLTINEDITVFSQKTNYQQSIDIELPSGYEQQPNKILVNAARYTEVKVGDYLLADYDPSELEQGEMPKKLTRILSKRLFVQDTTLVELTCDSAIKILEFNGELQTLRFTQIQDYVNTYKGFAFKGFKVREDSMPDGSEARQNEILNIVQNGSNMFKALTNKDTIDFRYLVDSFGNGLTEFSKQQLVDICGERLNCLGFINLPSMKQFKNSTSPTFTDTEGVLDTDFIRQGGDPESNPAFQFSLAQGRGVSAVGYFTPYLRVNDNGRPLHVPPAAWVASTYLRKFNTTNTNVRPWTISAGVTNGQVTGIAGLEVEFQASDIENFNDMQVNPIVSKRNRGFVIETQNTAQTLVRSALSFINVREVLIELQNELSDMLLNFQWRFNTADVRAEIKERADQICERFVNQNGIFNYFNKIDEENNTQEIIDNQMGVLDTYIEPIRGMGIIVNNITILRTGDIEAGGFL